MVQIYTLPTDDDIQRVSTSAPTTDASSSVNIYVQIGVYVAVSVAATCILLIYCRGAICSFFGLDVRSIFLHSCPLFPGFSSFFFFFRLFWGFQSVVPHGLSMACYARRDTICA